MEVIDQLGQRRIGQFRKFERQGCNSQIACDLRHQVADAKRIHMQVAKHPGIGGNGGIGKAGR